MASIVPSGSKIQTGRPFERLINFTDAIVAVAITVLVLPIVGIRPAHGEETIWQVISDNSGQLTAFFLTFIIVAVMWRIHNRIFSQLAGFDDAIFWLNLLWLVLIAILPWSSSMYGSGMDSFQAANGGRDWFSGGEGLGGVGLVYWLNLAGISIVGGLVSVHARRTPDLVDADAQRFFANTPLVRMRGFIFGVYMISIGIMTVFLPMIAVWMPFGFFLIGYFLRRQEA